MVKLDPPAKVPGCHCGPHPLIRGSACFSSSVFVSGSGYRSPQGTYPLHDVPRNLLINLSRFSHFPCLAL